MRPEPGPRRRGRALADGLRLAVGTLTVVPTGAVSVSPPVARWAMLLAPVAVAPAAAFAAALGWLAAAGGAPDLLVGAVVVGVIALVTRGLHLDGLADTVDGFASGWDRERSLTVMRCGDVGPAGVVALVLVLVAQAAAVGALTTGWRGPLLVALAVCGARTALTRACVRSVPAARPDGLGAAVAGTVPVAGLVGAWVALLTLLVLAAGWSGLVAGLAALVAVDVLVRRSVRRFGGVTGDVMGAAVETACTALLVGLVLG